MSALACHIDLHVAVQCRTLFGVRGDSSHLLEAQDEREIDRIEPLDSLEEATIRNHALQHSAADPLTSPRSRSSLVTLPISYYIRYNLSVARTSAFDAMTSEEPQSSNA